MRTVQRVDNADPDQPIKFTHYLSETHGWVYTETLSMEYDKIVYVGNDKGNGDIFVAYRNGNILIYKGHLNSGKY